MTTTQAQRTHCKNCGMKLPEQPLSLCAYCAMPLDLGTDEATASGESPNAGRIGRISEHDSFEGAMAWEPAEGPDYWRALRLAWRGKSLIATGAVVMVLGSLLGGSGGSFFTSPGFLVGVAVIGIGIFLVVQSSAKRKAAVAIPLLKRPGLITDRRSETAIQGMSGSTTYYFTIEFENGVTGEFTYPGRGSHEEPYATNLPGIAYTRGPVLIAFKHIRV